MAAYCHHLDTMLANGGTLDEAVLGTLDSIVAATQEALRQYQNEPTASLALSWDDVDSALAPAPDETLLLVEDDISTRHLIRQLIGQRWCLLEAASAAAALPYLQPESVPPIDLVLLDLNLPDPGPSTALSGLELMRQLPRPVPFMVLTADRSSASQQAALQAGALNYYIKPPDPHNLRAAIITALDRAAERRRQPDRHRIHQAIGILMATHQLSAEEVERSLQKKARAGRGGLAELAQQVIAAQQLLNVMRPSTMELAKELAKELTYQR